MTDNEIKKALECCLDTSPLTCKDCPMFNVTNSTMVCSKNLTKFAIDLINRQQAEIEDLNHSIDTLGRVKEQLKEYLSETEAKYQKEITRLDALLMCKNKVIRNLEKSFENAYYGAIKEFAKRLKLKADGYGFDGEHYEMVDVEDIDDTYEEMVGEQE